MTWTYDKPLVMSSGPKPELTVLKVKHGVTEISLSDGRLVRISLHIDGVKQRGTELDFNYSAVVEVMPEPTVPIMDVHEGVQ